MREYRIAYGVLDLAPPPEKTDPSLAQQLMESKFYAKYYEEHMRPKLTRFVSPRSMQVEYQLSAKYLDLADADRVLDVACGTGNYTRYFANLMPDDKTLVGIDLSWSMLRGAAEYSAHESLTDKIFWSRVDATRLPFRTATFDRVHCSGALHMMSDIDAALSEFSRVCEPGGMVVIGTFIKGRGIMKRVAKFAGEKITKFRFFEYADLHERLATHRLKLIEESIEGDAITVKTVRTY